jgi:small nuclear ribonucleoprotein G
MRRERIIHRRRIARAIASHRVADPYEDARTRARAATDPSASSPRRYMDKKLRLRLNGNRSVIGTLRGFDQFLNLVLDDATNDTTSEQAPMGMVVVRGNSVVSMEALEHIARVERRGA